MKDLTFNVDHKLYDRTQSEPKEITIERFINTKCSSTELYSCNGCDYILGHMLDGWIAIIAKRDGKLIPLIQAKDMEHVKSFCDMRENPKIFLKTFEK